MNKKSIIIGVGAGMISILGLANQASADTRRFDYPRYNRPAHQEIRGDRKEIFKDRVELRRDLRELRKDKAELRQGYTTRRESGGDCSGQSRSQTGRSRGLAGP